MATPLTGAWMRGNAELAPMYSRPLVASPRHSEDEPADERQRLTSEAPPMAPSGASTHRELGTDLAAATGATPTDRTDRTPKVHAGTPMHPGMTLGEAGAVHSVDLGAHLPNTIVPLRLAKWGDDDRIIVQKDTGPTPPALDGSGRLSLIRGLNSYPENNPAKGMYSAGSAEHTGEGWRRGAALFRRQDHDLSLPVRHHRFRVIWRRVAEVDTDTPGTQTVYGTMHSSLARAIPRQFQRPRLRRPPGEIDEGVVTDGTESPAAPIGGQDLGTWV